MADPQKPQTEPDVIDTFRSLPRERQSALLQKMSPEQKTKLTNEINLRVAKTEHPGLGGDALEAVSKDRPIGHGTNISANPAWYTPAGLKQLWYNTVYKGSGALPAAGGAVGAVAGGTGGSVPGAIGGAALGGAAGEAGKQLLRRAVFPSRDQIIERSSPKEREAFLLNEKIDRKEYSRPGVPESSGRAALDIGKEAAIQAAFEATGQVAGRAVRAMGQAARKSEDLAMARILGVTKSTLKGGKADVEAVRQIGEVVNKEVKGAASLESFAGKVKVSKEAWIQKIEDAVTSAGQKGKLTNLHQIVKDSVFKVTKKLQLQGRDTATQPIVELAENLKSVHPENATPAELLAVKRLIREKAYSTGAAKDFRSELEHELNAAIARALPTKEARQFLVANGKVSNLIRAESAVQQKMLTETLRKKTMAEKLAAPLHAVQHAAGSTPVKMADIYARRAAGAAAPKVAKGLQHSPQVARALQVIQALTEKMPQNMLPQGQQ